MDLLDFLHFNDIVIFLIILTVLCRAEFRSWQHILSLLITDGGVHGLWSKDDLPELSDEILLTITSIANGSVAPRVSTLGPIGGGNRALEEVAVKASVGLR